MPRFKGSCGCYNREDARTLGLVPAIVWNDMLDRSEHFNTNPMWYDQKDAAERLGIPERTLYRAVDVLVEAGRIAKKKGYRPNTTISTTWITINEEESVAVPGTTDLAVPRNDDLAVPILNDTKEPTNEGDDDIIPLAAPTTPFVEITIYDSDDNCNTIAVKHQVPVKSWNKAVRKWRKDPSESIMLELMDGGSERMTFKRIKKYNVRPKASGSVNQYNGGTAFKG